MEQVAEMISSLEQAVLMAKQIGTTVEENHLQQIWSSLDNAHHRLSAFLSSTGAEKSLSSAEPMQLGEEEKEVEKVEERMRECFIKNKRRKRRLSPSSAVAETSATRGGSEEMISPDYGFEFDFDPHATKLRALDLIYQFHG